MKYTYTLRWFLLFVVLCVAGSFLHKFGLFARINQADFTKISFVILALFIYNTLVIGKRTLMSEKKQTYPLLNKPEFMAGMFLKLGMTGTVLGFIYMLSTCFKNIDPSNIESMQQVLSHMSLGMSTALYTTAVGLICNIILKLQIFNLEQFVRKAIHVTATEGGGSKKVIEK